MPTDRPERPDAERRRELRRVARRLHPDRGGDLETYLAAVAEVEGRRGPVRRLPQVEVLRAPGWRRALRRLRRQWRARLWELRRARRRR